MLNGLGFSVSVKIPAELKTAAKALPEFSATSNRMTAAVDAMNITMQTVVVAGIFGVIVAVLLFRDKK